MTEGLNTNKQGFWKNTLIKIMCIGKAQGLWVTTRDNIPYALSSKGSGSSCSKLTTSLVNDLLKFTSSDTQIC